MLLMDWSPSIAALSRVHQCALTQSGNGLDMTSDVFWTQTRKENKHTNSSDVHAFPFRVHP